MGGVSPRQDLKKIFGVLSLGLLCGGQNQKSEAYPPSNTGVKGSKPKLSRKGVKVDISVIDFVASNIGWITWLVALIIFGMLVSFVLGSFR